VEKKRKKDIITNKEKYINSKFLIVREILEKGTKCNKSMK